MGDGPPKRRSQTQTERDLDAMARRRLERAQAATLESSDGTPDGEQDEDSSRTPVTAIVSGIRERVDERMHGGVHGGPHRGIEITRDQRVDAAVQETVRAVVLHTTNVEERARVAVKAEEVEAHAKAIAEFKGHMRIVKWVGVTLATFVLASVITVGRMLFGWGREDGTTRAAVDRVLEKAIENRADIKELRSTVEDLRRELAGIKAGGRRYSAPAPTPDPGGPQP